jgi:hypothetical protein
MSASATSHASALGRLELVVQPPLGVESVVPNDAASATFCWMTLATTSMRAKRSMGTVSGMFCSSVSVSTMAATVCVPASMMGPPESPVWLMSGSAS